MGVHFKNGLPPGPHLNYSEEQIKYISRRSLSSAKFRNPVMNNEELVKNHSAELIQNLVTEVIAKEKIEIRFEFEDNEQWSVVTTFVDEEDKEISLRLHANDLFNLYVGYYNDDVEFLEI